MVRVRVRVRALTLTRTLTLTLTLTLTTALAGWAGAAHSPLALRLGTTSGSRAWVGFVW